MVIVIFDMDGVLYRGIETIPEASGCIEKIQAHGIRTGYLTNNSGRTRENIEQHLADHGITAEVNQIMTSGEATARYLTVKGESGKRIYVVGRKGLVETLRGHGFDADDEDEGDPCDFVVVGWDRGITFNKIARTQHEILVNGAKLIATNNDAMFPADGGRLLPGAGTMVAAVETASNSKAEVIGKPKTHSLKYLIDDICEGSGCQGEQIWMVGDRLDTDIVCGNSFGAITVCVTTGIASRTEAEHAKGLLRPDHVIDSLDELPAIILSAGDGGD